MNEPNIVILAGGISSRMKKPPPGGINDPDLMKGIAARSKSMIGVGENSRPFMDYLLYNVEKAGYIDVVIVVGETDPGIRDYYEKEGMEKRFPRIRLSYAVQKIPPGREKPLGTADALLAALTGKPDWKGKSFTVCNSDNLYSREALELIMKDGHENAMIDYDRSVLLFERARIEAFSVIRRNAASCLTDIVEKPSPVEIENSKDENGRIGVSMNIFRFSYDRIVPFLEAVPLHPARGEKELPAAVKMMISKHPGSVYAIRRAEHVIDLTSPADIAKVRDQLKDQFPGF